jgi:hypothetical protein
VAYIPDWESLADALKRVIATGATEDEAKAGLCHAVADRRINVRIKVASDDRELGGRFCSNDNIEVPADLKPDNFDWKNSWPYDRWRIGPTFGQRYSDPYWIWQPHRIELVLLATADVIKIFGSPESQFGPDDEDRAAVMLRDLLIQNPHLKTENAFDQCRKKYPKLSERGFRQRVWPKGRQLANLPAKAPSGRKPKSSRSTQ